MAFMSELKRRPPRKASSLPEPKPQPLRKRRPPERKTAQRQKLDRTQHSKPDR